MTAIDILIPTWRRKTALAITLTSLLGQTFRDFDVIISDQTEEEDYFESPELQTIVRAFEAHGQRVHVFKHLPRRGMAEQRHFLLEQSRAPYVQYVDDDLLLEPQVVERMFSVMQQERCGFVGCAAIGLQFRHDYRPWQQNIELWEGPVQPEHFTWETAPWGRHKAHNAANAYHLALKLSPDGRPVRYKVAWVGANVLYDRAKLLDVGGFSYWELLPREHCGEEVLVQTLLLRKYGGCGVLPSGTYHIGLPTLIPDRTHTTNPLIKRLLAEMDEQEQVEARKSGS